MASRPPTLAIVADLHGNLPATEAVLADVARVRPDLAVFAGDYINRGPQSAAVLQRIGPLGWQAISGNHDTWISQLGAKIPYPPEWDGPLWTPVRLTLEQVSPKWIPWLRGLPPTLRVELPGADPIRVVHGSPRDNREGMGRMAPDSTIREAIAGVTEGTIVGAHIHYPWHRELDGRHIFVIGSVGCPFNDDPSAQYGLFTWDGARWQVENRSVPYDHAPVFAAWREEGFLRDHSLVSALMLLEQRTARTQYVPFWEWSLEHGVPFSVEQFARFTARRGSPGLEEVVRRDLRGEAVAS
jgi:predicted phosphodiesterase